jgi:hypothetical protein
MDKIQQIRQDMNKDIMAALQSAEARLNQLEETHTKK